MVILVVVVSLNVMFTSSLYGGGFFRGLFILLVGGISVLLTGGSMYLGIGIYHNTKKTAELLEKAQAQR